MFKRLRWMIIGAILAFVAYQWVTRRASTEVPEAAERFVRRAEETAGDLRGRLSVAYREGVAAMREKDAELRRELLGE